MEEYNDPPVTISFIFSNQFGEEYSSSSTVIPYPDLGVTELDLIGQQFNIFLKQIGYYRKNDNILLEDLTDEEYDALHDYLEELRSANETA